MNIINRKSILGLVIATLFAFTFSPGHAKDKEFSKPEELVTRAKATLESFAADENMIWFRNNLKNAKAVMIVPRILKAGFIVGGSGGSGALLARDTKTGDWSNPAFYTMGSGSIGLQIGAAADRVILMIMTKKAMDSYLSGSFKLGTDVTVAAGPFGTGAGVQRLVADVIAFHQSKGVFGGLKIDGAVIAIRDKWNSGYYGKEVRPTDILILRSVDNPRSADLRGAVKKVAGD
jgi:lipid-binding SYLF domain-containing protein